MKPTAAELRQTADAMDAFARGEKVEVRAGVVWTPEPYPTWNRAYFYRPAPPAAAEKFPEPPAGDAWHNPAGLTPEQVGVRDGWRLMLKSEGAGPHAGTEYWRDGAWQSEKWLAAYERAASGTLRTKRPLPAKWTVEAHIAKWFRPLRDGERPHRADFTKDMLPDGWRPLLAGERTPECSYADSLDEFSSNRSWSQVSVGATSDEWDNNYTSPTFVRTRRPLPEPARAWDCPEDVPGPVCWLSKTGATSEGGLIVGIEAGYILGIGLYGQTRLSWSKIAERKLHYSTDRKTWKPCTKE